MASPVTVWGGRKEFIYGFELVEYDGFFYEPSILEGIVALQTQFRPRADDVFVCSGAKSGTTWVKAIVASIMCESKSKIVTQGHPQELIPTLEIMLYGPRSMPNASNVLAEMPSPRLLGSHLPYTALPDNIKSKGCKIIYIARNPRDTFVSHWKFLPTIQAGLNVERGFSTSKDEFCDGFCRGISLWGPYDDHVLSFWNPSTNLDNILFLTYEDLKADPSMQIRKIADFLGKSYLTEEDIHDISAQCSFNSLSNLDVNRNGNMRTLTNTIVQKNSVFRKGEVGDWKNHFTPEMNSRFESTVENKFKTAGLCLKYELPDI